jgi:hypothetical protein
MQKSWVYGNHIPRFGRPCRWSFQGLDDGSKLSRAYSPSSFAVGLTPLRVIPRRDLREVVQSLSTRRSPVAAVRHHSANESSTRASALVCAQPLMSIPYAICCTQLNATEA